MGADLVREARRRAGLTQRQLAERAATTQSAIARWERGSTAISLADVVRLCGCCGFDLEVALVPHDDRDLAQAERLLALRPQERLERHARLVSQLEELRRAAGA